MALTITQQCLRDSNSTGSLGTITPTAGGVLLCMVETATNGVTFTHEGTLSASWVQLYSFNSGVRATTMAVWYATTYSGTGTVDVSQSAGTWNSGCVALALDVGVLNLSNPFRQTVSGSGSSVSLTNSTNYGTWGAAAGGNAGTTGGYTVLGNSAVWDSIGHASNITGNKTFTATSDSALVAVEFNNGIVYHLDSSSPAKGYSSRGGGGFG